MLNEDWGEDMGRLKGYKLSEEQKAKKEGVVIEKLLSIPIEKKLRGRPKGFKKSAEEIRKQKETRLRNKLGIKEEKVYEKPLLKIYRHWKTGFDFWEAMRNVMRPLHRYADCRNIERQIVKSDIWENREEIVKILSNYFVVELKNLKVTV